MREKSTYIKLIAIFLIFFVFMFLAFGLPNIKQNRYEATVIVSDEAIWNYHNK